MIRSPASHLTIRTAASIHDIDPGAWDALSAGRPFQSHRWYQVGERVMQDCEPAYLLAYLGDTLVGRAALWVVRDEPLPIGPGLGRSLLESVLRHWPLLISRSPLANASGLLLPSDSNRSEVLRLFAHAARELRKQKNCSFLLFDFIGQADLQDWPDAFLPISVSDPGMVLQSRWKSLDAFLADGDKKGRQHYKRTQREAEKLGITIEQHERVDDVPAAMELIHNLDSRYSNAPNPWLRRLLEQLDFAGGTWLEARQNGILVGCGALLEDNGAQLTTALGLAKDVPYAYLLLTYASLEDAFSKNVRLLRWGSGAYDVKKQLGFESEANNHTLVSLASVLSRLLQKIL